MSDAFPVQEAASVQEAAWPGLAGDEAATAVILVAAMVERGDLPRGLDRP